MSLAVSQSPSLNFEKSLSSRYIIGMDEVGRGCIAGDVAVGAVLIDLETVSDWPSKLKDSKLLTEKTREELFPELQSFGIASAVGLATVIEIETQGIMNSLALAGSRAIQSLLDDQATLDLLRNNSVQIILDGNHNYLATKSFGFPVITKVKADASCVSVAAASVLAKVTRDRMMIDLASKYPGYGFESNKGYGSAGHRDALQKLGTTPVHRTSWLSKILAE